MIHRTKSASSRRFTSRATVLVILSLVCAAYGATAWFARGEEKTSAAKADAQVKKATHPPINVMRERMLKAYHGQTTATFTALPGFGMDRMPPLYKLVPFTVPDLSTNDVEIEKQIAPPEPLKDVFAKSLRGFHDPAKPLPPTKNNGFGRDFSLGGPPPGVVRGGLQLRLLDLVGLVNADGPKVYSGGKAFEYQRMSAEEVKAERLKNPGPPAVGLLAQINAAKDAKRLSDAAKLETRPLDVFETTGVADLRDGKDLFIRTRGNVIRMLGALRATEQCLECHSDNKKGDLLGAFSYTFVDARQLMPNPVK